MRHIHKSAQEPQALADWKAKASPDWQPHYADMPSHVKRELKRQLTEDQQGLCCYCESRLRDNYSHIEHFRPQETYPELSLDFRNLLCFCQSNLRKGDPCHCGNAKGNWFSETTLISPLSPDCASHFRFTGDGHIHPADAQDQAAIETIAHLCLDIPKLVAYRQAALAAFLDTDLSDEDFSRFLQQCLSPDSEPPEYISAIRSVFLAP